jgi:Glycosyl hydrolase family 26
VTSTGSAGRTLLTIVVVLAIIGGAIYAVLHSVHPGSTSTPKSVAGGHVLWGICANPRCTGDLIGQESALGRKFAVVKTYHSIIQSGLTPADQQLVSSGHSLLYSISPVQPNGAGGFSFDQLTEIAAGRFDNQALGQLKQLNGIDTTPYIIFDGEPENILETRACSQPGNDAVCGPQFVAAWRHLHDLATRNGLTRIQWVWNLTAKIYITNPDAVHDYYPGKKFVDWMGVDPYNQDCGSKAADYHRDTFGHLMAPVMRWHDAHAKSLPISLTEWGAPALPGDPNAQADWLKGAASFAKKHSAIQMMVYWDGGGHTFSGCDFSIRPGTPAFAAFRAIGLDSHFQRY